MVVLNLENKAVNSSSGLMKIPQITMDCNLVPEVVIVEGEVEVEEAELQEVEEAELQEVGRESVDNVVRRVSY